MSAEQHPPPYRRRPRQTRERTRDMDWWADRELSQTVACPPWPKGCRAPIGAPCRDRHDAELINQPAHQARLDRAMAAEPAPATEETP